MAEPSIWEILAQKVTAIARNPIRSPDFAGGLVPLRVTCPVCRAPIDPAYAQCRSCHRHRQAVDPAELADLVVPLSYAVKRTQYYYDLWSYKRAPEPAPAAVERMKIMMAIFTAHHWDCVVNLQGSVNWLTSVPSGHGRSPHPLETIRDIAATRAAVANARFVGELRDGRAADMRPDDFDFERQLHGHVLIIEDTWVAGNNAQALAVKAKRRGAERVTIVVLGRVLDPEYSMTAEWIESTRLRTQRWNPDVCPVGVCSP